MQLSKQTLDLEFGIPRVSMSGHLQTSACNNSHLQYDAVTVSMQMLNYLVKYTSVVCIKLHSVEMIGRLVTMNAETVDRSDHVLIPGTISEFARRD